MDMNHWMLMIVAVLGSMFTFTAVLRMLSAPPVEEPGSLQSLTKGPGELSSFDRINPQGGIIDRIDFFLARNLGFDKKLEELHVLMGQPEKPTPLSILHYKEIAALVVPAFVFYMMAVDAFDVNAWVVTAILVPVCFILPDSYFKGKVQERQRLIMRSFPAVVDLEALTIESGLDYMSAFDRILKSASKKSELDLELEKTLGEVQLGYSRPEALRRFAKRTGIMEIRMFVGLIVQSEELGTSLVDLLRNFSQDMRFRRMNKAEKAAAQASTKMLFPIFFFIFPTVFILMLAPMMMNMFQGGLGF
ncbi:MAG: type II secretion system F family protein [Proteobacteria bacterium]|nr:type II secretion system F family protein [Pseudomonadota bacterium]